MSILSHANFSIHIHTFLLGVAKIAMDLIHKLLNVVLSIFSLFVAPLVLPPYLLFKALSSCLRSLLQENVAGKVVLITGASSGIGEHLAYEYAKRGACLALVARRLDRLQVVAEESRKFGSKDVIVICADVSKLEDCKRFVEETVRHFGRLDHLVNNAGIAPLCSFEDYGCVSEHTLVMNINFWGSVYSTQFALPHLRKSKGKIIVISSTSAWLTPGKLSIYSASKAALTSFYEALRKEIGSDVGITIVTPGMVESEITTAEFLSGLNAKSIPLVSTEGCCKAIVDSVVRGDKYLTEPAWMKVIFFWKLFCPELIEPTYQWSPDTKKEKTSHTE